MNESNAASYFWGLLTGALVVGGVVAGYFTRWDGYIPVFCTVVGSTSLLIGTMIHLITSLDT